MDNPKISVLIPLYNRKHYIAQCVDSALNQTFKEDYEIIIRDDGSTDGSYDFVAENYSQQISEGKIKLRRNKKNSGEFPTSSRLFKESKGKYVMILHSDDMYLPHALQHLYEVAEQNNADVVHESFIFNSPMSGIINDFNDCTPIPVERTTSDTLMILPDDPELRFNEWMTGGTFIDTQYNIFNREFVLENDISFDNFDHRYMALWWIMTAKVLVKTPIICYIRRDAPDSGTNSNFPPEKIQKFIIGQVEMLRNMDRHFANIDFFKDNPYFQYMAKAHLLFALNKWNITRNDAYANGITPEIYTAIEKSFKEKFGENYFYPLFLFNWSNVMPHKKSVDTIIFENNTPPPNSDGMI